jgi:hypothetical protein
MKFLGLAYFLYLHALRKKARLSRFKNNKHDDPSIPVKDKFENHKVKTPF